MDEIWREEVIGFALDHDTERHVAEQKAAIAANPEDARSYLNLGLLYQIQYKQDLAVEYFLKALSLDPRLAAAHVSLGRVYAVRGETEKAWQHARVAAAMGNNQLLEQLERYQQNTGGK